MRFFMFPGPQNDAEMGSKWRWVKWVFWFFFGSLLAHCYEMAPERPKYHFFFKMVPIWTAFLRLRLSFSNIFLTFFPCPLSFFEEKDINMWAPLCFLFGFLFKLCFLLCCYKIKYEKTWKWFSPWSAPEQVYFTAKSISTFFHIVAEQNDFSVGLVPWPPICILIYRHSVQILYVRY